MYGYICDKCGANLDPGERCDCEEVKAEEEKRWEQRMEELFEVDKRSKQLCLRF